MADIDWSRVVNDPRFQILHRKKQAFLTALMAFSVIYYFLLPIGAGYWQDLFRIRVWGVINVGIVFALSEFIVARLVAWYYARRAGGEFDRVAAEISAQYSRPGGA